MWMWRVFYGLDLTIDPSKPVENLLLLCCTFKVSLLILLKPNQANAIDSIDCASICNSSDITYIYRN